MDYSIGMNCNKKEIPKLLAPYGGTMLINVPCGGHNMVLVAITEENVKKLQADKPEWLQYAIPNTPIFRLADEPRSHKPKSKLGVSEESKVIKKPSRSTRRR